MLVFIMVSQKLVQAMLSKVETASEKYVELYKKNNGTSSYSFDLDTSSYDNVYLCGNDMYTNSNYLQLWMYVNDSSSALFYQRIYNTPMSFKTNVTEKNSGNKVNKIKSAANSWVYWEMIVYWQYQKQKPKNDKKIKVFENKEIGNNIVAYLLGRMPNGTRRNWE